MRYIFLSYFKYILILIYAEILSRCGRAILFEQVVVCILCKLPIKHLKDFVIV